MNKRSRGFTLIELLVVIAVIAILSGIIITSIAGSRAKSRDAKRISDINQIQLALEQYFDRCSSYPTSLTSSNQADCIGNPTGGIYLSTYIAKLPTPPSITNAYDYSVRSDYLDYVVRSVLENTNSVLTDSLQPFPTPPPGKTYSPSFTCTTANNEYCVGPK